MCRAHVVKSGAGPITSRVLFMARLRNALSPSRASGECGGRWFTSDGAPPRQRRHTPRRRTKSQTKRTPPSLNPPTLMFKDFNRDYSSDNRTVRSAIELYRQRLPTADRSKCAVIKFLVSFDAPDVDAGTSGLKVALPSALPGNV